MLACKCAQSLSHVQLFTTPWTVALQALLPMGFPRLEYWNGLPFPSPGDLPNSGIKLTSLMAPALAGGFFTTVPPGMFRCSINCCCSVVKLWPTLCGPMDHSTPGFPVLHDLPEFAQTHVRGVSIPTNYLLLCHPLLHLPSIFPSIRVIFNESALRIRWPKQWSFSFSISPSNEYSGLISFSIAGFDLLAVQETLKSLNKW